MIETGTRREGSGNGNGNGGREMGKEETGREMMGYNEESD